MGVKIKICGITNPEDATWVANFGGHYVGMNFSSESPRKVSVGMAKKIVEKIPPFVVPVGVFVEASVEEIAKTVQKVGLKGVQLHGDQSPEDCLAVKDRTGGTFVMRAFRLKAAEDVESLAPFAEVCDNILLDAHVDDQPGGTGQTFPWEWAKDAKKFHVPVFLAGGLTPDNVGNAIKTAEPFAVDVASGVERLPKRKDFEKMRQFIENATRA